jgi:hypothetical protein
MFAEYTLKPEARTKALIDAMLQSGILVFSAIAAWLFLYIAEPEALAAKRMFIYIFMGVLFALSILTTVSLFRKMISFRMVSTDAGLEIITISNTVTVNYSAITKVERTSENILLVYTTSSDKTPVVAISDTITNRHTLEGILQQFVPITEQAKLPLIYNRYIKLATSFVFLTAMFIHYASGSGNTIIAAGVVTLFFCAWSVAVSYRFRKELSIWRTLILMSLIALVVCFRIWAVLFLSTQL